MHWIEFVVVICSHSPCPKHQLKISVSQAVIDKNVITGLINFSHEYEIVTSFPAGYCLTLALDLV